MEIPDKIGGVVLDKSKFREAEGQGVARAGNGAQRQARVGMQSRGEIERDHFE